MIRKSNLNLDTPAHQPIQSVIVIFWQSFGGLIRSFWPFLLYFFISSSNSSNWWLIFGSAGIALISFVFGVVRYYHFLYHVENGSLIISSGLFTKVTRDIPFERIQSIRLEQKFIHRILNLYAVRIDTAGSSKEELEIPALDHPTAVELKRRLNSAVRSAKESQQNEVETHVVEEEENLVFSLSLSDILRLGLTANHLRNFFIILGVLVGISTQLGEIDSQFRLDRIIEYAIDNGGKLQFQWIYLLIIPFIITVSILVSIGFSLFSNYGLRVYRSLSGYRVNQGLINKKEQFAPLKKIQRFKWSISPLRKLLGLYSISIKQASSSETSQSQSIKIPGAHLGDVHAFVDNVFGIYKGRQNLNFFIHHKFLYRYFLFLVVIPVVIFCFISWYFSINHLFVVAIVWSLLVVPSLILYYENWRMTIVDGHLQLRKGVLTIHRERFFMHKLQGVRLYQTPYQVRHDLANVEVYTAAGNITLPYLRISEAKALSNYLVYRVESSRRAWM